MSHVTDHMGIKCSISIFSVKLCIIFRLNCLMLFGDCIDGGIEFYEIGLL